MARKSKNNGIGKPIRKQLTRSELIKNLTSAINTEVGEDTWRPADVKNVLGKLEDVIKRTLMPGGSGVFVLSGMIKLKAVKVPPKPILAIKKGTMVYNPGLKKAVPHKGRKASVRPATVRVKIRSLSKLTAAARGE